MSSTYGYSSNQYLQQSMNAQHHAICSSADSSALNAIVTDITGTYEAPHPMGRFEKLAERQLQELAAQVVD